VTHEVRPPPTFGDLLVYVWRLSRPEIWTVSVLPVCLGHVLATRRLMPGLDVWTAFSERAVRHGATFGDFLGAVGDWFVASWRFLVALAVMGPLLWAATLLINDVHDLPGDRVNPRKARSPLVQGLVTLGWAHAAAYVSAALTLAGAATVNLSFLALVAGCVVLAWLYSVPPIRLKTRPGMDVAVNAVGIGVLAGMAGWAVARPVAEFPFAFLPQGLLVATAIYVPTTLWDVEADRASGYLTIATHLGPERTYRIGWWAWVLCNAGALFLSWHGWIIPERMFVLLVIFTPLMLWEYHAFVGGARTQPERVRGMMLCALTFLAVNAVFALMYTGLWVG
jgi:chlorophyll synthase